MRVIPAVLADNAAEFRQRLERAVAIADHVQIDIMDGMFVPERSIGISDLPELPSNEIFEAHLMTRDPRHWIPVLRHRGFAKVIVHIEAHAGEQDVSETIRLARASGLEVMLALNPDTTIERMVPFLNAIDGVLFMGVPPGAMGRAFVHDVTEQIEALRRLSDIFIQVDGGITPTIAKQLARLGVNAVNSGSYLLNAHDPRRAMAELRSSAPRMTRPPRRTLPVKEIELRANRMREEIVTMITHAKSGHTAGSLGLADIFATLYFHTMHFDAKHPAHQGRDYLFVSNGHVAPVWYAALAEAGVVDRDELLTFRAIDSRLQGHPHVTALPGIENSGGPLGQGLSQATGAALGLRMDGMPNRVFCICSDGEHQEGQTWENALFAAFHKLDNLTCIMDRNNIQIDGFTDHVLDLEPLAEKYRAFNWHVIEVQGHDIPALIRALETRASGKPTMIIAKTTPGKGVPDFEHDYRWHGRAPTEAEAGRALQRLERIRTIMEEFR